MIAEEENTILDNKIAWFKIWLHKKQLRGQTCEKCDYFVPFMCYVDKGDCIKKWNMVNIWTKSCEYFKIRDE